MSLERAATLGTGVGLILGALPLLETDLQTAAVALGSGLTLCAVIAATAAKRAARGNA